MSRDGWCLAAVVVIAASGLSAPATAHTAPVERLATARPEAWAMRYFAAALLDSGLGEGDGLGAGGIEAGVELGWLPSLSARQRTVGFDGTKEEDLNRSPVVARPVVRVGLPLGLAATLGWVPPIELDGATANVLTAALSRSFTHGDRTRLELRLAGSRASVRGDFTCPAAAAAAGADPVRNPYGCEAASRDEQRFATIGFGAALVRRFTAGGSEPEARLALAAHHFDGSFHVDALYGGFHDQARLENRSWLTTVSAGLALAAGRRSRIAFEVFYAPLAVERPTGNGAERRREADDLLTARALVTVRLR